MDTNRIRQLEKEYFDKIINIFNSPQSKFKKHLLDLEDLTRREYAHYNKVWGKKNKIDVAVERMLRYHLYRDKSLNIVDVYTSPLSTDIAIELKDIILCIDAKTVDLYGNLGDEKSLAIQKNQITFRNKPESGRQSESGIEWPGILFPPHLEPFYLDNKTNLQKPCLTYFINFYYEDDGSSFKLSHMCFSSVPHGQIVEETPFNKKNLAHGFKSWDYIEDDSFGKQYQPVIEGSVEFYQKKLNWYKVTGLSKGKQVIKSYIDTSLYSPIDSSHYCLWKKPTKPKGEKEAVWKVSLWGGSARINKNQLLNRVDHNNRPWEGVKEFRIGKGHTPNYLNTGAFWGITKKIPLGNRRKTESRQKEIDAMIELQGDTS
jgi:hypothetical protein